MRAIWITKAGGPGAHPGQPIVDAVKYSWFSRPEFRRAVFTAP